MDIRTIMGSLYTVLQSQLQQCQIGVLVFKLFTGCRQMTRKQELKTARGMWARMPLPALVGDIELEEWHERMPTHLYNLGTVHHIITRLYLSIGANLTLGYVKLMESFTLQDTYSQWIILRVKSQTTPLNKQSHVMILTEGQWKGNIVALPNNRVRVASPAYWITGDSAPDFRPSQHIHCAEQDDSYMDPEVTFNNLYKGRKMMKKGYAGGGMMKKMMKKADLDDKMKKGGSVLKMKMGGNVGDLRSASKEGNKGMSAMIASGDKGKGAAKRWDLQPKKVVLL